MKFKIGDRIRMSNSDDLSEEFRGKIGVLIKKWGNQRWWVKFDDFPEKEYTVREKYMKKIGFDLPDYIFDINL